MRGRGALQRRRRGPLVVVAVLAACLVLAGALATISPARDATASDRSPAAVMATNGAVVDITTRLDSRGGGAAGTGIVVSPQGEVLTNNHVIRGATEIRVTVPGGSEYPAQVLGTDAGEDVALVQVLGTAQFTPATVGDSSTLAVGDPVSAIGNAGGVGGTPTVTSGTITGLDQSVVVTDADGRQPEHLNGLIETDAPIQPGDSGGPLVDAAGRVIGMDTAATVEPPGQPSTPDGFAIPIDRAMAIVRSIQAGRGSADIHLGPAATPAVGPPA